MLNWDTDSRLGLSVSTVGGCNENRARRGELKSERIASHDRGLHTGTRCHCVRRPTWNGLVSVGKFSSAAIGVLVVSWCLMAALAGIAWLLPLDVAQGWAVRRADNNDFAMFEAYGAITATMWFVRCVSTLLMLVLGIAWRLRRTSVPMLARVASSFWHATIPVTQAATSGSGIGRFRIGAVRLIVVGWLMLGVYQLGCSINRRLWDWPLYQLHAGQTILPNISENNREVIRFLAATTPPNARILVLSDQKLYFLSYYLLPRRLYHPSHPDSVFVIAKPYNQRQLASYRLQDLTADQIQELHPDYILEYFEGKQFIEGENLSLDSTWLNFQRRRFGPGWQPSYLVSLRPYSTEKAP
ncbi:MAG: hypothetical protein JWP89_500 [Schlesneria sp.]|nr:hypothetical protein [Schlesneria sp.]